MPGRVFVFEDYFHEDRALIFLVVFFSNLVGMVWGTELMREQTDLGVRDLTMTWTSWINTVYLSGSLGLTQAFLQLPGVLQTWFSMKQSNYKQGILTDNNIFKKEKEKKTESGRKTESSFSNRISVVFRLTGPWMQELLWYCWVSHSIYPLCFPSSQWRVRLELSHSCCTHHTPDPIPVTLPQCFVHRMGELPKCLLGK